MNVSQFCGLTATLMQERIQQDLDIIANAIIANEKSDSEI